MREVEGWLDDDEADLLIAGAARALHEFGALGSVVEVGSYVGRSTCVLGSAAKAVEPSARVFAIDPHEGLLTGSEGRLVGTVPTLSRFRQTLAAAGLEQTVVP